MTQPPAEWQVEVTGFTPADAGEVLVLQRCCWVTEAINNDTLAIPALHEDLGDVLAWQPEWEVVLLRRRGRLVGAVRARRYHATWEIGRLMVAPDQGGRGLGRWLLAEVERRVPADLDRYFLYTGARSTRNLRLYERAGYRVTSPPEGVDAIPGVVYLAKPVSR